MYNDFLTGVFSLIASLVGTFGGILTSTKLTNYQINELKKQVDKHNSVIERTFKLEEHNNFQPYITVYMWRRTA